MKRGTWNLKRLLTLFLLSSFIMGCGPASSSPEPATVSHTYVASDASILLYSGKWMLTKSLKRFSLCPQFLPQSKIIKIDLSAPFEESGEEEDKWALAKLFVIVDNKELSDPFYEGGQVLVEAEHLVIYQQNEDDSVIVSGTWEVVQEKQIPVLNTRCALPAKVGASNLLGAFGSETEAVIQFEGRDLASNVAQAVANVYVDGVLLEDSGVPIKLREGSSVVCRGKTFGLTILAIGERPPVAFYVDLRVPAKPI